MHVLNHVGKYFKVRGPLNVARPVQGWPLIVQAGASDSWGRQLAAETAEMIFSPGGLIADCQSYYNDVKARAAVAGRDPEHVKILTGCLVVVGDTDAEARAKRAKLDSLVHPDSGALLRCRSIGMDASKFDLNAPLPDIPETNQSKSGRDRVVARARRDNLTVGQLAQILGAYGGLSMVGTAKTIADKMEEYFDAKACDGFNIMFPWVPGGLDEFVDHVVPELQRRGVFRKEYEGKTLRENLGLPRPPNRFFLKDGGVQMTQPRLGGHILAAALVAQGIDHVFEVPGESFLDTLDGLHDTSNSLKLVTCRFEAGAVNMAEAYGKLKGRPAAAMVTRGPGACHGSIGVHIAMQDSTPMLLFVGQIPHEDTGRDAFQEVDYRQMFAPLAKWVTQIDHAHRIPEIVAHAVDVAVSGRPGPVVIALSEEMQKHSVSVPDLKRVPVSPAHPDPAALQKLRAMLAMAAKRPIAVVGGSCWTEAGRAALGNFLVRNNIPVTVGFRRQAHYDGAQANFAGDLGVGSDPGLIRKIAEADLILALGSRLGDAVTQGYTLLDMAGAVPIIQVLPDGAEIGRVFRPALGIVSDLNVFAHEVAALEPVTASWSAWTRELRSLREAQRAVPNYEGGLNLGTVMRELETMLSEDAIVTTDAGNFAGWATRFLNFSDRQRYIGPTNGAMGYSVPAAIGASITFPGRMVVSMVGDGGFMMTGQELATAFHHGSAPIVLVFNNNQFGTIRMHQERAYPWRVSGTQVTNPDFSKYIEAFGGHGEVVSETAAFAPAFRRAVGSGKPAVIELRMNPDQITTRATVADLRAGKPPPPSTSGA